MRVGAVVQRCLRAMALLVAVALVLVATGAVAVEGLVRTGLYRTGYGADGLLIVLAIGSDIGPPQRPGNPAAGRADGIHLFVVDPATSRMTVVDVPRDSAIGGTKVNAHLAFGGPERLEAALEAWSGLDIDYYVMGSFQSVQAVTTSLGGIVVNVPQRMADPFSGTDLQPGPQTLGPDQTLAFARDRKSLPDGDIGRSRNQTVLMLSALQQTRAASRTNLTYIANVVATLRQHTLSNIPAGEMVTLAYVALRLEPQNIEQVTLSGPFGFIGDQSVIYPQPGDLFPRLMAGQVGPQ
ncbi:MAG: LCP family protein [Euzebya sp.]